LVAAGHVDTVAAAVGFLALALVSPSLIGRGEAGGRPSLPAGLAAGALVGMAADIKITFILFGLGIALAARRSVRTVLAAGAGALAVLVPSYLWFGPPAVAVLFYRDAGATSDNFYQLFSRPFGLARPPDLLLVAVLLLVAAGWLLIRRLPAGAPSVPRWRSAWPGCSCGRSSGPGTTRWCSACSPCSRRPGSTGRSWPGWARAPSTPCRACPDRCPRCSSGSCPSSSACWCR